MTATTNKSAKSRGIYRLFVIVYLLDMWSTAFTMVCGFLPRTSVTTTRTRTFYSRSVSSSLRSPSLCLSSSESTTTQCLNPGDTVAVIGASGNVGKLVALRLSDTYRVHGVVRSPPSPELKAFLAVDDQNGSTEKGTGGGGGGGGGVELFVSDLVGGDPGSCEGLTAALKDARALVLCTGTTAFPTQAWTATATSSETTSVAGEVARALWTHNFSVKDALRSLDEAGLNTPNNVDDRAVTAVLKRWAELSNDKVRAVLLSSIGVDRRTEMPFPVLNACGVLDAKAAGERSLREGASAHNYSYTILRPGQLFGGPYDNNYYLGTLFQLDKDSSVRAVQIQKGDTLTGDTLRSTLAELTAQVLEGGEDCARDTDFAVINVKGEPPSTETILEQLRAL